VTQRPRLVVGMWGSSAARYGIALLETSHALGSVETHLVLSDGARRTIQLEADLDPELVGRLAEVVHHPNNLAASTFVGLIFVRRPARRCSSTTSCSVRAMRTAAL
jgi:3-polyprenyl-4-hydroxybenzoate decarboxylase